MTSNLATFKYLDPCSIFWLLSSTNNTLILSHQKIRINRQYLRSLTPKKSDIWLTCLINPGSIVKPPIIHHSGRQLPGARIHKSNSPLMMSARVGTKYIELTWLFNRRDVDDALGPVKLTLSVVQQTLHLFVYLWQTRPRVIDLGIHADDSIHLQKEIFHKCQS